MSVIEKVVGYKKIKFHTHENTGYGDVRLPDIQMHTTSFWLTIPLGGCSAAAFGFIFGLSAVRIKGFYLAVATLAEAQLNALWLVLEKVQEEERDTLANGLVWLSVVAVVAPLLGLLAYLGARLLWRWSLGHYSGVNG